VFNPTAAPQRSVDVQISFRHQVATIRYRRTVDTVLKPRTFIASGTSLHLDSRPR
jgi:hypothetical protein